MTQMVADATVEPSYDFSRELTVADLIEGAKRSAADVAAKRHIEIAVDATGATGTHRADSDMPRRLLGILLRRTCQLSPKGDTIDVVATGGATVRGAPGTRFLIRGHGNDWSKTEVASFFTAFAPSESDPKDLGLDLLSAFFICYHHGGELRVHPRAPDGPGFEVILPHDPEVVERLPLEADFLEGLLTKYGRNAAGSVLS
jgi:K+-sensing histidine kinase KdpD